MSSWIIIGDDCDERLSPASQIRPLNVEGSLNLLASEQPRLVYFSNSSTGTQSYYLLSHFYKSINMESGLGEGERTVTDP